MTDAALLQHLLSIEKTLTASIKGQACSDGLPSDGELHELKTLLDRIRPLLWIYLTRAEGRPMLERSSASAG